MLNKSISGYTILRLLGKGGMADVYYAENNLHRPAAIKVLHKAMTDLPEVRSRFEHEARIIVRLDHPNIRKVYDVAEIEERPAIVMEYLDGNTLSEALAIQSLHPGDLTRLYDQAVSGLQYAHHKGVVHRDIKPSNLFLTSAGDLKILDFGIAKVEEFSTHTMTGQSLGTILYMSPEQVQDPKRVDYRTDIYSLGVTFYHLVSRNPPYDFTTDSVFNIQVKIVREDLKLDVLSPEWRSRLSPSLVKSPVVRKFYNVGMDFTSQDKNSKYSGYVSVDDRTFVDSIPLVERSQQEANWMWRRKWAFLSGAIALMLIGYFGIIKQNIGGNEDSIVITDSLHANTSQEIVLGDDMIKAIYIKEGFDKKGSYEQFKSDLMSMPAFRKQLYEDRYKNWGTFEKFEKDLGIDPNFIPVLPIYVGGSNVIANPGQNNPYLIAFYKNNIEAFKAEQKAAVILNSPGDVLTVARATAFKYDKNFEAESDPGISIEALGFYLLQARIIANRSRERLKLLYNTKYNESKIDNTVNKYGALVIMGRVDEANKFLCKYPELVTDPNVNNIVVANQRMRDVSIAEAHVHKDNPGFTKHIDRPNDK